MHTLLGPRDNLFSEEFDLLECQKLVRLAKYHDAISPPKPVREGWSGSRDLAPGHVTIVQMSRDLPSRSRDHQGVTWANSTRDPKGKLDKRLQRHLNPLVGIPYGAADPNK